MKLLADIEKTITLIDIHLEGRRDFAQYAANITKRHAVERALAIIGEATAKLLKFNPDIQLSYARTIVDLRNRVIHSYDTVDDTLIWKVIIKDIPVLLKEVQQLLAHEQ